MIGQITINHSLTLRRWVVAIGKIIRSKKPGLLTPFLSWLLDPIPFDSQSASHKRIRIRLIIPWCLNIYFKYDLWNNLIYNNKYPNKILKNFNLCRQILQDKPAERKDRSSTLTHCYFKFNHCKIYAKFNLITVRILQEQQLANKIKY